MKTWIVGLLVLVGTLLLSAPCVFAQQEAVVVGCPLAMGSSYGQNGMRGLTLAMEEINAKGGIKIGGKQLPIKLEIVDTGDLDPKVSEADAMAKVASLITEKNAQVLIGGPSRSEYGLAAMDVVAANNVAHIVSAGCYTPKWDKEKFASDREKYKKSFRMSGDIAFYISEAKDLLGYLKKTYGFSKMYILTQDVLMCRDAGEIVKKVATGDGWEIVGQGSAPTETTDFKTYLEECKKSGAQVLFIWNYSPNTTQLFEQWRNLQIPAIPLGFVEAAEDPEFWTKTGGKCAYAVITLSEAGVTPSDVTPLSKPFFEAYKKRWGVAPRSTGSAASYEALYVLKDAAERAGGLDPAVLVPALEKTNLQMVRGQVHFDQNHQAVMGSDPKASILGNWAQWQDGNRVTVWPVAGKMGDLKLPPWLQMLMLKKR